MNVDKLIETLNQALQKAGGEAARVWPDMVAQYAFGAKWWAWVSFVSAGVFGLVALACLGLMVWGLKEDEDCALGGGLGALVTGFAAVIFMGIGIYHLGIAYYPEAALVRSLVGK